MNLSRSKLVERADGTAERTEFKSEPWEWSPLVGMVPSSLTQLRSCSTSSHPRNSSSLLKGEASIHKVPKEVKSDTVRWMEDEGRQGCITAQLLLFGETLRLAQRCFRPRLPPLLNPLFELPPIPLIVGKRPGIRNTLPAAPYPVASSQAPHRPAHVMLQSVLL